MFRRCFNLCLLLALAGCRSQPYVNAHIETVNAEYRQLEDYVYSLEEENARLCQELDSTRQRSTGTRSGSGGTVPRRRPSKGESDSSVEPPTIEIPGSSSPSSSSPGIRSRSQRPSGGRSAPADTPPDIEIPAIEVPVQPASQETAPGTEPLPLPDGKTRPASLESETSEVRQSDAKITHLVLNPLRTGGANFDNQPGDDGLCVVLEPRNANEEYVPQAGPVSVVVLDPSRQGESARLARWDFDLSAMRQLVAASSGERGIKLELPWPAAPPECTRVKVFVRYETDDGRRLQADREIHVTSPGQAKAPATGWTPRSAK
jgi:hypothetical protein